MSTSAGVGFSNKSESKDAGAEAARRAMEQAKIDSCDVAMIYTTSKQDPKLYLEGVRSIIGPDAMVLGGWAVGIISNDHLGYGGYESGVTVLKSDTVKFHTFIQDGLGTGNEFEVGYKLGKQIKDKGFSGEWGLLLKYDSIRENIKPLPMNMGTPIVRGIDKAFDSNWPGAAGVGLLGDMQFNPTFQWYGNEVVNQSAMALVIEGATLDTVVMHGCVPAGQYHTVTKVDGPVILEIDNKPAVEAIADMLGPDSDRSWEEYPLFVTLGWNKGEKFEDFKEENYANRLCIAIDKERGGLVMLEDDITAGVEVQLMRRNISDFSYLSEKSQQLLSQLEGRKPIFAYYIDCAGRASAYCGSESEDAEVIQKTVGSKMPLMGVYSGVELAKVGQNPMMALDWTGVLCVFSEA